jgi:hypothetical protein
MGGYLRGALSQSATPAQMNALAAYVAAGSVSGAARFLGIRPSTVKRYLAGLRGMRKTDCLFDAAESYGSAAPHMTNGAAGRTSGDL